MKINFVDYMKRVNKTAVLEWAIVFFGIVFRFMRYYSNPLPRPDCLVRLYVMQHYSFWELLKFGHPLEIFIHDPYGILFIQKAIYSFLGNHEYALRIFPFFCSVASLFLFRKIKDWLVGPWAGIVALGLLAFSPRLIHFTVIVNTYASDVLVTILLFMLFKKLRANGLNLSAVVFFSLAGALSVWFSLTAIFCLTGAMITFSLDMLWQRQWRRLLRFWSVCLIWTGSFLFYYFYSLTYFSNIPVVRAEWGIHMLPYAGTLREMGGWFLRHFYDLFINPIGVLPFIGIICFIIGIWYTSRQNRVKLLIMILPFLLVILASFFHKYPLWGRLLVFLLPVIYCFIGQGCEFILKKETRAYKPVLTLLVLACVLYRPIHTSYHNLFLRPRKNALVHIMEIIKKDFQEGDIIYVHRPLDIYIKYYAPRFGFEQNQYILGFDCKGLNCAPDIEKTKSYKRVWYIADTRLEREVEYILKIFRQPGRCVFIHREEFHCYLFENNA